MGATLYSLLMFLIALFILITFHEFGHYWVARRCGVSVLRFSIGFGRPIYRWFNRHGTEFCLARIPLGGYVKMLDEAEGPVDSRESLYAFNAKPLYQRMLIVAAGPAFNFILAIVLFWLMFVVGFKSLAPIVGEIVPQSIVARAGLVSNTEITKIADTPIRNWRGFQLAMMTHMGESNVEWTVKSRETDQTQRLNLDLSDWQVEPKRGGIISALGVTPYVPPIPLTIGSVMPNSPAAAAGFRVGDTVVSVNQKMLTDWRELVKSVRESPDVSLRLKINRAGLDQDLILVPESKRLDNGTTIGLAGLQSKPLDWPSDLLRTERYGLLSAWGPAFSETGRMISATFKLIWKLLTGDVSLKAISGPIGIAQGAGETASVGFAYYLGFLAMISVSLGVLNSLPIPMLDGGHLLYDLIELIRGRAVSLATRELAARLGMLALLLLMAVALVNDLQRLFG